MPRFTDRQVNQENRDLFVRAADCGHDYSIYERVGGDYSLYVDRPGLSVVVRFSAEEARSLAEWIGPSPEAKREMEQLREIAECARAAVAMHCGDHLTPEAIADTLEDMAIDGRITGEPGAVAALINAVRAQPAA